MAEPSVLVVGAGPTGLVLALRLARQGIRVRIVDKADGPGSSSRAMVVHARTLEFYRQIGLAEKVIGLGIKAEHLRIREGGREVADLVFGDIGEGLSPYPFALCLPQDDHERFLVGELATAGIAVEWGVTLKSFSQDAERVSAILEKDGAEERCDVAYLCGCDGAHSAVRHGLGIGFPGGTYDGRFYVADVRIAGPFRTDVAVNLGVGGLLLLLPVRSRGVQRLIGTEPEAARDLEEAGFEDFRASAEALLDVKIEEVNWFSRYRVHHRVADRFAQGRVFIAGDAGHVHSPAGGQGMNTGIGDAVNLSWKLADVLLGRAPASLLDSYETERIAFARQLVATTDRLFQRMVSRGLGGRLVRTLLVPAIAPLVGRTAPLRRLIFRFVSQIRIAYPQSPLSEGKAGAVRGGDRLPWVPGPHGDNFAALDGRTWRLQVYGETSHEFAETAGALGLPVDAFPWRDAAGEAGFAEGAVYLVRPDGHVALAMRPGEAEALPAYAERQGLRWLGEPSGAGRYPESET